MLKINVYDGVEVGAVKLVDGNFELCNPRRTKPTYWSVYGHLREGGVCCISDHRTRKKAVQEAKKVIAKLKSDGTLKYPDILFQIGG